MLGIALIISYIIAAELYVAWLSRKRLHGSYNVILLLGCNGSLQSPVTLDRVKNAILAKIKWPQARFLLSGNEDRKEITVYRHLLRQAGFKRFAEDLNSHNTWQNMHNSLKLLKASDRVLIVTSKFHAHRALAMARSVGIKADTFNGEERRYEKSALYFTKERLSIYLNFPKMLFAKLISRN